MSFRDTNEDLFEQSRMSFGEHLEELRKVLIKALYGVAIGCVFGAIFASPVIEMLVGPLRNAIDEYRAFDAKDELTEKYGFVPPEYLSLIDHGDLAPKQVLLDPAQLAGVLKEVIPDLDVGIETRTYNFRAGHFDKDELNSLCKRLSKHEGKNAEKLKAIWEATSPTDRQTIERVADLSETSDEDLKAVVAVFNRVTEAKLFESEAFESDVNVDTGLWGMLSPKKPKPLVKIREILETEFDSTLNRRLNRALITPIFDGQMPPAVLDLVPFEIWESTEFEPQALGVGEGFSVWLKAAVFTGLTVSGPWVFYQLWSFVAAGLYPHEQKHIHVFLPISIALFVAGVLLAFFFVFQPVLGFLFSFNRSMGIAPQMRINEWLSFVMFLPLGFGLAFQLPLVMLFMNRIGLFEVNDYLKKWRVAVMIIFVLAMFLTPADPISMMLLAVPLSLLYFLGIGMCKWMPRSENPFGNDIAPAT